VGKTVESYRIAIEDEISRWNGFAKALRREERAAFDVLINACRNYASAGSNATQPLPLDPMIMSMLVAQQIHLQKLQKEIDKLKQQKENPVVQ
jgi:hypothetical protein